jgi:hypothetical protein
MTAAARPRPTPAEVDEELQLMVDLELGHPRTKAARTTSEQQADQDSQAVHAIADLLRSPEWDTALLEEICDLIRDTGRPVGGAPLARLAG